MKEVVVFILSLSIPAGGTLGWFGIQHFLPYGLVTPSSEKDKALLKSHVRRMTFVVIPVLWMLGLTVIIIYVITYR